VLNENLEAVLGLEFTPRDIEAKSTAELAEAFGRIVYESMATLFEEKKTHVPHVERKKPANIRLQTESTEKGAQENASEWRRGN
jgi:hypothetical protein